MDGQNLDASVQRFVKLVYSALLGRVVFLWLISRCLIE
jgi:hypothetical protein